MIFVVDLVSYLEARAQVFLTLFFTAFNSKVRGGNILMSVFPLQHIFHFSYAVRSHPNSCSTISLQRDLTQIDRVLEAPPSPS